MERGKTSAMVSLAVIGLFFSATAIANEWFPELAPQSTVDTCVAEIGDHADYTGATRVRHQIESEERRNVGHTLRIKTLVYGSAGDKVIHVYATKCIVGAGEKPVKFVIKEATNGA